MRYLQQNVQGTSSATYENACSGQAARLCHVRSKIRPKIPIDRAPTYALGTETVQMFGMLASFRSFNRIEVAHEKAYRGKAVQVRRM